MKCEDNNNNNDIINNIIYVLTFKCSFSDWYAQGVILSITFTQTRFALGQL